MKKLLEYMRATRGIGHTEAAVGGVLNTDSLLLISEKTTAFGRDLEKLLGIKTVTQDKLFENGVPNKPIVIDNSFVLHEIALLDATDQKRAAIIRYIYEKNPELVIEAEIYCREGWK